MSTTLEPKREIPSELRAAQRRVLKRLEIVRRRLRLHLLVEGVFWLIAAIALAAATSFALDRMLRFNLPTRLGLLTILGVAIVAVAYQKLVRPLLLPLGDLDLAELLDRRSPGVGQRISNVLQLPELLTGTDHASPSMVRAAVAECASDLDRVDLTATFNVARRRKLLAACGAILLVALLLCAIWPATAWLWARRWLAGSTLRWPQHTYLTIVGLEEGTRLLVPRGEVSLLQINARPEWNGEPDVWTLLGRGEPLLAEGSAAPDSQSPDRVGVSYTLADGTHRRGAATQFDESNFRFELPPLAEPVELHLSGGDDWLGPLVIEPIDRPAIRSLEITSRQPKTGQVRTEPVGETSAQLLFLPETQLELRMVATAPLKTADALDKGQPAAGWRRVDEQTYTLSWTMQDSLALEFRLVGSQGELSSKPYFLAVGLLKDREPRVTIRSTGVGRRITPVARVPLVVRATDDFGVASLALDWELTVMKEDKPQVTTKREPIGQPTEPADETPKSEKPANEKTPTAPLRPDIEISHELALRERGLVPGNTLKLRGAADDACLMGAQSGHSRWLTFQIVSQDELFYEILTRQREQRAKFTAALESAKTQGKILAELTKPEEALAVARAHQVIGRQVWQVANQLEVTLQEMTLNELSNAQARSNLETAIIVPLRTLHDDLLARLRTSLEGLGRQSAVTAENRAEAERLSEEALTTMQSILAQMSLWENFIDVVKQLEHIIKQQNAVLKDTQEHEKKRTDDLFDK